MKKIKRKEFLDSIKSIQIEFGGHHSIKLQILKYIYFLCLKPNGIGLVKSKEILDDNLGRKNIPMALYNACKPYIDRLNSGISTVKSSSYDLYKCNDNPYSGGKDGEFACECMCNKPNTGECKKYKVATITTVITREDIPYL